MVEAVGVGFQTIQLIDVGLSDNLVRLPYSLATNAEKWPDQLTRRKVGGVCHAQKGFENGSQRLRNGALVCGIRRADIIRHHRIAAIMPWTIFDVSNELLRVAA